MATVTETWYVRLPNGRTLRARSADAVRRHLRAGRIPPESRVRRLTDERWLPLAQCAEFAAVLRPPAPRPAVRRAANRPARQPAAQPPGVGGLINELLKAVDNTLTRTKLTIAALTGIALAIGLIGLDWAAELPTGAPTIAGQLGAGMFIVIVLALASALLTRKTVGELDRHRPTHAADDASLLGSFAHILIALTVVAAVMIGLLLGLRAAGPALAANDWGDYSGLRDALAAVLAVLRVAIEVLCWPVIGVAALLLGPLLVVEEAAVYIGLREWLGMLRRHLGRIYLYEALAFMLASVLALPLVLMVGGAAYAVGDGMGAVERIVLMVVGGAALAPAIAYLLVANVFVYINLRYEFYFAQRQR